MRTLLLLLICAMNLHSINAQKYYTKNGSISFFSKASIENITASNSQVMSTIDLQSGELQFSVLIKAFHFKKILMEEHFNENYLESDKFPKATFRGNVQDIKTGLSKDGSYPVKVSGDITIHGVTKKITTPGTITVQSGIASASATFKIKLAEYNISIPKIVKDNIAETIDINVACMYDKKL